MVNYLVLSNKTLKQENGKPLFSGEYYHIFEKRTIYEKDNIYYVYINDKKYIIKYAKENEKNQLVFEKEDQNDTIYNNLIYDFYKSYPARKICCKYYRFCKFEDHCRGNCAHSNYYHIKVTKKRKNSVQKIPDSFKRFKNDSETTLNKLKNDFQNVLQRKEYYKTEVELKKKQIRNLIQEKKQIQNLIEENKELKRKNEKLKKYNEDYRTQDNSLKLEKEKLKEENQKLRNELGQNEHYMKCILQILK